jgi:hypothetical protein
LDDFGKPIPQTKATTGISPARRIGFRAASTPSALIGSIDENYTITVKDLAGRDLETFTGSAGEFSHAYSMPANGLFVLAIKTKHGTAMTRIVRPIN